MLAKEISVFSTVRKVVHEYPGLIYMPHSRTAKMVDLLMHDYSVVRKDYIEQLTVKAEAYTVA